MSLDISDLPGYGVKFAKFQADKGQAEAKGDQLAILQAENAWSREIAAMQQEKFTALEHGRTLDAARTQVATKFPAVKPELYAHIQDPVELERFAATIQASIDEGRGTAPIPPAPGTQSWGQAPPPPSGQVPPPPEKTREEQMEELRPKLNSGLKSRPENAQFRKLAVAPILDRVIGNASNTYGFDLESGRPLEPQR